MEMDNDCNELKDYYFQESYNDYPSQNQID